ncbi:DUF6284 family protein [Streptomyces lydicus]|uniref:DUF6284 family protein n=1 Tax=Streptomyces lydicus TaxID=47763 RepID=UPI0037B63C80
MKLILPAQDHFTATVIGLEPTDAELDQIEREMPVISAEVELLDAQIMTLDRLPNELDVRRIRRAGRKVLATRRELANQAGTGDAA